jgi:hypothetical protein
MLEQRWCCLVCNFYADLLKPTDELLLVKEVSRTKEELFDEAFSSLSFSTTLLRLGCYVLMVTSICLLFLPITALLGFIPLVGGFISGIFFFAILLGAIIVCIPITIILASIAWLWYRPKVGIFLILIGLSILAMILIINQRSATP